MGEQALRDHFAGLAMQEILRVLHHSDDEMKYCAKISYKMADAMLKEREKKEDGDGDNE